jgi:RHS repeat-associated protein
MIGKKKMNCNELHYSPSYNFSPHYSNRTLGRHLLQLTLLLAAACTFIWPASSFAQNVQYTQNKPDQALRSDLRVDPSTLGMSIAIPLGSYPGRAGNTLPITLNYSSKVWRINYLTNYYRGTTPHSQTDARFAEQSLAGWTTSLDVPRIEYTGKGQVFDYANGQPICTLCENSPEETEWYYIKRIHVHLADGSSHELRKDELRHNYHYESYVSPNPDTFVGTFYAVDGSGMRFVSSENTLYLSDGSRYLFDSTHYSLQGREEQRANQYFDRNGNTITYNASARRWTDTLGRDINVPLPATLPTTCSSSIADCNPSYNYPGIGNNSITYTLHWRNLGDVLTPVNNATPALLDVGNHDCNASPPSNTNMSALFPTPDNVDLICAEKHVFNPVVLSQIDLPNGQHYQFTYNIYGEIDKVSLPTGGYEHYNYGYVDPLSSMSAPYNAANRGVLDHWVSTDGTAGDEANHHWHYAVSSLSPYTVTSTAPDNTISERILKKSASFVQFGFEDVDAGMATEERIKIGTQMLRRKLTHWVIAGPTNGGWSTAKRDPRVDQEVELVFDPDLDPQSTKALARMTTYEYDTQQDDTEATGVYRYNAHLNVKNTKQYHFIAVDKTSAQNSTIATLGGLFPASSPALVGSTDYLYDQAHASRNLNSLPVETRLSSAGTDRSKTHFTYDEAAYQLESGYGSVTQWSAPGSGVKRGNATTIERWVKITGTASTEETVKTHTQYDQCGSIVKTWDARFESDQNKYTQIDYDSANAFAYPIRTSSLIPDSSGVKGSAARLQTSTAYDFWTGRVTSITDANNRITNFSYYMPGTATPEPLNRLKTVSQPDGGSTTYSYVDGIASYVQTQTVLDTTGRTIDAYQYFDGLGLPFRAALSEGTTSVFTDTQYDSLGRISQVSNPYRTGETPIWTTTEYDNLGRAIKVSSPLEDGQTQAAHVDTAYGITSAGTALGSNVTVTDQAGKKRRSATDALGRLIQVVEDPTVTANDGRLNYLTNYTYDALGNLLTVTQGSQTPRTFAYDALSRLLSADNPESGHTDYLYDANGNLKEKTDARLIKTTFTYDDLNRVINRTYAATGTPAHYTPTPPVDYYYDGTGVTGGTINDAKGHLTKMSTSGVSETGYTAFDPMGRVTAEQQVTDGQSYAMAYSYDLAGNLTSQQYPSGRIVTNSYDVAGRINSVSSPTRSTPYAGTFSYAPQGAIKEMQLGNGLWEHAKFNRRLQPTEINLGTAQTGAGKIDRLQLGYSYGTTDNNGNVQSQSINVPAVGTAGAFTTTQTYEYDAINRLLSAKENDGANWRQRFIYDQFGNRNFDYGTDRQGQQDVVRTTLPATSTPATNPVISQATNRIDKTAPNQTNVDYDNAGNLTVDPSNQGYSYDGENHLSSVAQGVGAYSYDGDGHRVKKVTTSATTIYVYNAMGQMVAEYSTATQPTPGTGGTSYLTADNLGTPRVITDSNGGVRARHDYLPFGEELFAGTGGRTGSGGQEYPTYDDGKGARQKFTGKERDNETGLDYFGARYYGSTMGRFTSPDPLLSSGTIESPQSWNRYAYVLNNPIRFNDPLGLFEWDASAGGSFTDEELEARRHDKSLKKSERKAAGRALQFRSRFRGAMSQGQDAANNPNLTDEQRGRVLGAVDSYGSENDHNGVTVGVTGQLATGVGAGTILNDDGTISVTFLQGHKGKDLIIDMAHEGQHVLDADAFLASGAEANGSTDLTHRARETRGYEVSSFVAQALGVGSTPNGIEAKYQVWNKGWKKADVDSNRAKGIDKLVSGYGPYHYPANSPGKKYSEEFNPRR